AAEFQLNQESGERYSEIAKVALEAARDTGEASLISKALFECARAGTEEGIDELARRVNVAELPMAILTKSFCRFSLGDPNQSLQQLQRQLQLSSSKANAAELAFLHSGIGIASHFLGRVEE